jgi:hypothetical protein
MKDLFFIDAVKSFFYIDHTSLIKNLIKQAENLGKKGVSIVVDAAAFYHCDKLEELIKYELSMQSKFDIELKRFCIFHKQDFERFKKEDKQKLLEHHGKNLIVVN